MERAAGIANIEAGVGLYFAGDKDRTVEIKVRPASITAFVLSLIKSKLPSCIEGPLGVGIVKVHGQRAGCAITVNVDLSPGPGILTTPKLSKFAAR